MPPKQLSNRDLPPKEQKAFKELLADYESRSYKKGLKTADGILKKFPDHGETSCMKGIILFHMGRKEEGFEIARKGLRADITSHICWHVHALMHKADGDPEQALSCYLQAVRIEPDQVNVLRDVIHLQLYFRHYEECIETRLHMLRLQPKLRTHWTGLAVAYHLAGRTDDALTTLEHFEGMLEEVPKHDYDFSELALLHTLILEQASRPQEALTYITQRQDDITDRLTFREMRARLLEQTKSPEAEAAWRDLLSTNPDNHSHIRGYLKVRGLELEPESIEPVLATLDEMSAQWPKSLAIRNFGLWVATGEAFKTRVQRYLIDLLTKGVPSLFADLKPLYEDSSKRQIIEDLVEGFRQHSEQYGTIVETEASSSSTVDAPTTYIWVLYFLAQHYSHLGHHTRALDYIDRALAHTPTLPDLCMTRARLLKRAGDFLGAEVGMTEARLLDGQDRFLNCKAVKYLLRVNRTEEAETIAGLFTRKEALSSFIDLLDMQALWFLQEQADAYRRLGKLNLALKRYHQIDKIFGDFREDESDFHSWCLRKGTYRAYLNMISFEDKVRSHPAIFKASKAAIEIYLELADRPKALQTNGIHANGTNEEEEKKALKKAKKAEAKARAAAAEKKATPVAATAKVNDDEPLPPKDEDPNGDKLLATQTPLEAAQRFVRPLQEAAASRIDTWLLTFEISWRQKKFLQALQALSRASTLDPNHPQLHIALARFSTLPPIEDAEMASIIQSTWSKLYPYPSLDAFNAHLLQTQAASPQHILAAATALVIVRGSTAKPEAEGLVFQLVREETRAELEPLVEALALLRKTPLESSRAEEFRLAAAQRFPLANAFQSPEDLQRRLNPSASQPGEFTTEVKDV